MTLLISTLRKPEVLLTSDGRTTLKQGGKVIGFRDKTQKLFPVPGQPVVIAHHGQNVFFGHPIAQIVRDYVKDLPGNQAVRDIATRLGDALHDRVRDMLEQVSGNAAGIWAVGFGRGEDEPEHAEVFWKWEEDEFVTREGYWRATDIILGGDGKIGLHPNIHEIEEASLATVQSIHADFMHRAMTAKIDPNTVGGHVHEVLITPWQWRWTKEPAK